MLLLQRQSEPVDDGAQDLQELCHSVVSLCLVYKVVEDVVYLFPDEGSQSKKFSINSVKSRLEEISLSRILRVKQSEKLNNH